MGLGPRHPGDILIEGEDRSTWVERAIDWVADDRESALVRFIGLVIPALALGAIGFYLLAWVVR